GVLGPVGMGRWRVESLRLATARLGDAFRLQVEPGQPLPPRKEVRLELDRASDVGFGCFTITKRQRETPKLQSVKRRKWFQGDRTLVGRHGTPEPDHPLCALDS